jgi:hypothetical protein
LKISGYNRPDEYYKTPGNTDLTGVLNTIQQKGKPVSGEKFKHFAKSTAKWKSEEDARKMLNKSWIYDGKESVKQRYLSFKSQGGNLKWQW